jgi:hypothetical protein
LQHQHLNQQQPEPQLKQPYHQRHLLEQQLR